MREGISEEAGALLLLDLLAVALLPHIEFQHCFLGLFGGVCVASFAVVSCCCGGGDCWTGTRLILGLLSLEPAGLPRDFGADFSRTSSFLSAIPSKGIVPSFS